MNFIVKWFETRIDAFTPEEPVRPPDKLWPFYWHFVKPVWGWFAVLMAVGLVGSLIELALYAFVGRIVDMMKDAASPELFLAENKWMLIFWGFVALILRPLISTAHDLIKQ